MQCSESEALINKPNKLIKTIENHISKNNVAIIDHDIDDDVASITNLFNKYADILEECDLDTENVNILSNYDENAITSFAGYVAQRYIERNNYQNCRATMLKTPMENATLNEKYIEYPNADEDAPTVTKLARQASLPM